MPMLAFDTHAHVKRLIEAGFTEAQAEAHTRSLLELLENRLVTKDDLTALESRINARFDRIDSDRVLLGSRLTGHLDKVTSAVEHQTAKTAVIFGSIMTAGIGVLAAIRYFG